VPVAITLDQLGAELRRIRGERGRSLRQVEEETGISAATLSRIERGSQPELAVVSKLAPWLKVTIATSGAAEDRIRTDEDLKRTIAVHLRANRNLSEEVAQAIVDSFDLIMKIEMEKASARDRNK
jgi:transcriptional regulator with XRE-family HTH domain